MPLRGESKEGSRARESLIVSGVCLGVCGVVHLSSCRCSYWVVPMMGQCLALLTVSGVLAVDVAWLIEGMPPRGPEELVVSDVYGVWHGVYLRIVGIAHCLGTSNEPNTSISRFAWHTMGSHLAVVIGTVS